MRLVCCTEEWFCKYQDLCFQRNIGFKPWPSRLAILAAEGPELVAGAMVYDSTGPFLFFEHLVTNETAPLRVRWEAVYLMAEQMMTMCRMLGKVPQVTVRHRGIKRVLERVGLVAPGAYVMTCSFDALETQDERGKEATQQAHPPTGLPGDGGTCPTPAFEAPTGDSSDGFGVLTEVPGGRGAEAGRGVG